LHKETAHLIVENMARRLRFWSRRWVSRLKGRFSYGISRPQWYRSNRVWSLGPSHPFDAKRVQFRIREKDYIFEPVTFGRYRGHRCDGHLQADCEEIASYLSADGYPVELAAALAATSSLEGGFDSIQTYDRAKFSWGFIQFSGTGGLTGLLQRLEREFPRKYEEYFQSHGVYVKENRFTIADEEGVSFGHDALNKLHDSPKLWTLFIIAAHDADIRLAQVRHAYDNYYRSVASFYVPRFSSTLEQIFSRSGFGKAVLFDRAVHGGIGYAVRLFNTAAAQCNSDQVPDPLVFLEYARELDTSNARRWIALEEKFEELSVR
jgi:hypothetical protein